MNSPLGPLTVKNEESSECFDACSAEFDIGSSVMTFPLGPSTLKNTGLSKYHFH